MVALVPTMVPRDPTSVDIDKTCQSINQKYSDMTYLISSRGAREKNTRITVNITMAHPSAVKALRVRVHQ